MREFAVLHASVARISLTRAIPGPQVSALSRHIVSSLDRWVPSEKGPLRSRIATSHYQTLIAGAQGDAQRRSNAASAYSIHPTCRDRGRYAPHTGIVVRPEPLTGAESSSRYFLPCSLSR